MLTSSTGGRYHLRECVLPSDHANDNKVKVPLKRSMAMNKAAKLLRQGHVVTIVADSCLEVRGIGFLPGRVAGPVK